MMIKSIRVQNFRSIYDEILYFDNLTVLVGANGVGKSSFLIALKLFQSTQPTITVDDFYNQNTNNKIIFTLTFTNLSKEAKIKFASYIQKEELIVVRIFELNNNDKIIDAYYGSTMQNLDFIKIKKDTATNARNYYSELQKKPEYKDLPKWSNHDNIKEALCDWEKNHVDKCDMIRNNEQFFGFSEVASGYLGKYIQFVYIPAVRDASLDAVEGKDSSLTDLLNIVIREELMQKKEVQQFEATYNEEYTNIMNNENLKIPILAQSITKILNNYTLNAKINLSLLPFPDFKINMPKAIIRLVEDEYNTTVERSGHGLQRAFIMAMLQYKSTINKNNTKDKISNNPTLVLIIEEPELYQHPDRQRYIAKIFHDLSKTTDSGTQIVYSTHSPYFVGLDRIEQIRLLRKQTQNNAKPKTTKIFSTNIKKLAKEISILHHDISVHNIVSRLHMIQTPWINEGFFSKVVVLVEGDSDRAAIIGTAEVLQINLEGNGFSIIPCSGKGNLDKVAVIFKQLGIKIYAIWDGDYSNDNNALLKLFEQEKIESPTHIKKNHAIIAGNLETMLKKEIGELYDISLKNCMHEYNLSKSHAEKNPTVIKIILEDLRKSNKPIPNTLKNILEKIQQLNKSE